MEIQQKAGEYEFTEGWTLDWKEIGETPEQLLERELNK
jgi:hypothetical protein